MVIFHRKLLVYQRVDGFLTIFSIRIDVDVTLPRVALEIHQVGLPGSGGTVC